MRRNIVDTGIWFQASAENFDGSDLDKEAIRHPGARTKSGAPSASHVFQSPGKLSVPGSA